MSSYRIPDLPVFPKNILYRGCHISKMVMSNLSQPEKGDFLVMINKSYIENNFSVEFAQNINMTKYYDTRRTNKTSSRHRMG